MFQQMNSFHLSVDCLSILFLWALSFIILSWDVLIGLYSLGPKVNIWCHTENDYESKSSVTLAAASVLSPSYCIRVTPMDG